ncbi:MAG TPA: hypothetical protein PLQ93_11255 [Bacteroidia bacterium]|nr:hypothetical protein [Bacteroidia bacterium]
MLGLLFVSIEAANAGLGVTLHHFTGLEYALDTIAITCAVVVLGAMAYFAFIDKSLDASSKPRSRRVQGKAEL